MTKKNVKITLPSLLGTKEFTPTVIMQKFALAFMQNLEASPNQVLKKLGHSEQLIYQWRAKPGFRQWLNMVTDDYMGSMGLAQVKKAAFREALKHSAQDRKLLLERYDPEYKPQSALDVNAYPGRRPPDEDINKVIERNKKRLEQFHKQVDEQTIAEAVKVGKITKEEAYSGLRSTNIEEKPEAKIIGDLANEQENTS